MTGYTQTIIKYASDDSRAGTLLQPDGIGEVGLGANEIGQKLAVRFMLGLTADRVHAVRYQVFGCGFTLAACAAAAELAEGQPLQSFTHITASAITAKLGGLPQERSYCADLAAKALQAAANSILTAGQPVTTRHDPSSVHGALLSATDPVYRLLIDSPAPVAALVEDRQLFAGLLAVADPEPWPTAAALGLASTELDLLLKHYFPHCTWQPKKRSPGPEAPPAINRELRQLLRSYLSPAPYPQPASWLADILVARAAHPGHLWVAMGLFERPQLSAAIGRHLPLLLSANVAKMRWKRFFFKQLCEMSGHLLCKSPVCGDCKIGRAHV